MRQADPQLVSQPPQANFVNRVFHTTHSAGDNLASSSDKSVKVTVVAWNGPVESSSQARPIPSRVEATPAM
ncbi:MAG: hypothetical protein CM1200mP2_11320 [Planctomycetaceae bacterium]|nr:MAG: hypothetical protein CM1200mP2_11320 [Planctomycetaceae bacterium]